MAYSTEPQIRRASPFKDTINISKEYIEETIAQADDMIDSKIGEVYVLPLASTPPILTMLSVKLVSYLLYLDQNTNIEVQNGVKIFDLLKQVEEKLEDIRLRKYKLYDEQRVEFPLNKLQLMKAYPTDASSDPTSPNNTAPKFSINQKF